MVRNVSHHVELSEDLDRFVRDEVEAGRFADVDSAIQAALERLREEAARHASWRKAIEVGAQQADAGESVDGDAAMERVRARLRAKHGNAL